MLTSYQSQSKSSLPTSYIKTTTLDSTLAMYYSFIYNKHKAYFIEDRLGKAWCLEDATSDLKAMINIYNIISYKHNILDTRYVQQAEFMVKQMQQASK